MRTADPGEATITLKNPKLDGSSLAKRRKTRAELEPAGKTENCESDEKMEAPWMEAILRLAVSQSTIKVRFLFPPFQDF